MDVVAIATLIQNNSGRPIRLAGHPMQAECAVDRLWRGRSNMRRREFIELLGGAVAAWPIAAGAQQPVRVKRIGLMGNLQLRPIESSRGRLRELGYNQRQNLIVECRIAEGREVLTSDMSARH